LQEYIIEMPVLEKEVYFRYLQKVEQLRYHLATVAVRTADGERLAQSVLGIFGKKLEQTAIQEHMERWMPGIQSSTMQLLSCDPSEVTVVELLRCFWSSSLFPVCFGQNPVALHHR
jgi:hypothetical protein